MNSTVVTTTLLKTIIPKTTVINRMATRKKGKYVFQKLPPKKCQAKLYQPIDNDGYYYKIDMRFGTVFVKYEPKQFVRLSVCNTRDKLCGTITVKYKKDRFYVYIYDGKKVYSVLNEVSTLVWKLLRKISLYCTCVEELSLLNLTATAFVNSVIDLLTEIRPFLSACLKPMKIRFSADLEPADRINQLNDVPNNPHDPFSSITTLTYFLFVPCQNILALDQYVPKLDEETGFLRSNSLKKIVKKVMGAAGSKTTNIFVAFCTKNISHKTTNILFLSNLNFPIDYKIEFLDFYINSEISPQFNLTDFKYIFENTSWPRFKKLLHNYYQQKRFNLKLETLISDISTSLRQISCYINLCDLPMPREIKTLKEWHDFLALVYSQIGQYKNHQSHYDLWQHPEFSRYDNCSIEYESEICQIVYPKNSLDLQYWGTSLRFCVGTYDGAVHRGERVVLSLYKQNKPIICIDIAPYKKNWMIFQVAGYANQPQPITFVSFIADTLKLPCNCLCLDEHGHFCDYHYEPQLIQQYPHIINNKEPVRQLPKNLNIDDIVTKAVIAIRKSRSH